jgi:hypothetical protein
VTQNIQKNVILKLRYAASTPNKPETIVRTNSSTEMTLAIFIKMELFNNLESVMDLTEGYPSDGLVFRKYPKSKKETTSTATAPYKYNQKGTGKLYNAPNACADTDGGMTNNKTASKKDLFITLVELPKHQDVIWSIQVHIQIDQ